MNEVKTYQKTDKGEVKKLLSIIWRKRFIYCLLLPATVLVIIFSYLPIGGLKMAFQEYNIYNPSASTWTGLENFKEILKMKDGISSIFTTLKISLLSMGICFPLTIVFALMLNEIRNAYFKKVIQTVSYLPHFRACEIFFVNYLPYKAFSAGKIAVGLKSHSAFDFPSSFFNLFLNFPQTSGASSFRYI